MKSFSIPKIITFCTILYLALSTNPRSFVAAVALSSIPCLKPGPMHKYEQYFANNYFNCSHLGIFEEDKVE